VDCAERQRLFEDYHTKVNNYSRAVAKMRTPLGIKFMETSEQWRQAHYVCEAARLALERHEKEHG
jgi:hypothetical protein